jgi:hypothetical protein
MNSFISPYPYRDMKKLVSFLRTSTEKWKYWFHFSVPVQRNEMISFMSLYGYGDMKILI